MNETFLNVRGEDAVVDAVRRCWASLFGARTIFYRGKRGLDQAGMDIAVVVQRQLASTRAGVMFTVDPASGREDRLVIEGSFGLGEAVVSGSMSPDRYVVDKESLRILAREVRHKELVVEGASEAGGTLVREARPDEAGAPTLDDDEVRELAKARHPWAAARRMPGRPPRTGSPAQACSGCCTDAKGQSIPMPARGRTHSVGHVMAASPLTRDWSVGAVLAERPIDPHSYLLVVRPDAGFAASLDLRRRLIGLRRAGHTTMLVDVEGAGPVSDAMLAALIQARRRLAVSHGRLVVTSEHAEVRADLERAGLEPLDALEGE
jgi:phosphoenolpyruvate synthase/pyruvate phosphate dikinase